MDVTHRNAVIDAYFEAKDTDDVEVIEPFIDDAFEYEPLSTEAVRGPDGMRRYYDDLRPPGHTTHELLHRFHAETGSIVEGRVTGAIEGEPLDTRFCDVFEFDAADGRLRRVTVYNTSD